ncbi:ABC transporter permease [Pendulispora albinea]|uniref:ABC transporter permease n=1 Tax=Pendulispora albinea TaxID=2741071 RepID=A0ABZ2LRC0_9BACT
MLTIFGVAVPVVAFVLLRTVVWAWEVGAESAAKDRVVTRHKVTFVMTLPHRYVNDLEQHAQELGIKQSTFAVWFGGKDPAHDSEFFATFAVDPKTYLEVYNEMGLAPAQKEAWQKNRKGAIVGDVLARKLNWKVGDKITLQSPFFPDVENWEFVIEGIYDALAKSVDRSSFFFHYDYMNDAVRERSRDQVGWIVSRVNDPSRATEIGTRIDKHFEEQETQTLSQDEGAFTASFLASFSALLKALRLISFVILVIMALILGNTIAMAARERTNEYGVLRAIGFLPKHLVAFVLGESMLLASIGGVLGLLVAYPFVEKGLGRFIEENMGNYFPYFRVTPTTAILAFLASVLVGLLAGAIPAYRVSKLRVVDALRRVA